jgi:hypothetical protein
MVNYQSHVTFAQAEARHFLQQNLYIIIMSIPLGISEILLPQDDLNVVDLVDFLIPTMLGKHAPDLLALDNNTLFSKIGSLITSEKHISFLHSLSIPTAADIEIILERLENAAENPDDQEKPKSLVYPLPTATCPNIRLPLWVLEYWRRVHVILVQKDSWSPAVTWLKRKKNYEVINALRQVPWNYRPTNKELNNALDISDLALFCSEQWLRSAQMDTMSAVLNNQLESHQIQASVQPNNFFQKLLTSYRFAKNTYSTDKSNNFIRELAEDMKSGTVPITCTAVAVCLTGNGVILPEGRDSPSNHWCALIINVTEHTLHYGDPMGSPAPAELVGVITWWLGLSFVESFKLEALPITRQADSFSCSILTLNALSHYFFPSTSLLENGKMCLSARTDVLILAINLLKKHVSGSIESLNDSLP